jgi:hypothetical protein
MSAHAWVPGRHVRPEFGAQLGLPWAEPATTTQRRRWLAVYAAAERMGVPLVEIWYDRSIGERVEAVALELETPRRREVLVLLPGRTETRWFRRLRPEFICFLRGRLAVGDHLGSAPFPSVVQYLGPNPERFAATFRPLGIIGQAVRYPEASS